MRRALRLAERGRTSPNPMVGAVLVRDGRIVGEGYHPHVGEPHAEIFALAAAGETARGATLYVTLEPCCHYGRTPPCTRALIEAGVARVVAAMSDPNPLVQGKGFAELRAAGIEVSVGLLEDRARKLNEAYIKHITTGLPFFRLKMAMTLDGKIATRTGSSRWISSQQSREIVHALRGRVDAIVVGRETSLRDDPSLTARPPGPRTALRVVVDTRGSLGSESQLVRTAGQTPVLVAVGNEASEADRRRLIEAGCEVLVCEGETHAARLEALLDELGRRRLTNVLVEGGGRLLGGFLDGGHVDEVHAFIAPKLVGGTASLAAGGTDARSPVAGEGVEQISAAAALRGMEVRQIGPDVYVRGRVYRR